MKKNKGLELWERAKRIIPGGNQLLSKRSEMFLPNLWPSYYLKAKGVKIWDLNGNCYNDMSIMGVGTCILGYADKDVNYSVKKAIDWGNMTTLNCYEEIELAELLLNLHKWAGMVKYARTGGEAMAIAVRIGRAFSKRDNVAFCGYHGWHDWYLSANIQKKQNLDTHILPGLDPIGVPKQLKGTSIPFEYNNIDQLSEIVEKNNIGVIVIEPLRYKEPKKDFLSKIRKIAVENNIVLIFDEITTGWRMRAGGIYENFHCIPDIVVYGKAMSNGYPMACIVGKKEIMNIAQESFISSTYWTERIGPVAAITTINKLIKKNVFHHLIKMGTLIKKRWNEIRDQYDLQMEIIGIPPLASYKFKYNELNQTLYTFFTQEMLKQGYLASKNVYLSYSHKKELIEKYNEEIGDVFKELTKAMKKGEIKSRLKGPVAHSGFKRLT